MWSFERHDWSELRAARTAKGIPDAIRELKEAESAETAKKAYWRIDNTVVVQGSLYEAAVPAAECALGALLESTEFGRPELVELLFQLGNGESHPSEVAAGEPDLGGRCRSEICLGATVVLRVLETAKPEWLDLAVDLTLLMVDQDPSLAPRVEWYMHRLLDRGVPERLERMIAEWIRSCR